MRRESAHDVGVVLLVGALFSLAVLSELPYVNGPEYWRWAWRPLPLDRALVLFAAPALIFFYLLRQWTLTPEPTKHDVVRSIAGLTLCFVLFQYASLHVDPRGFAALIAIVKSPGATSYFGDAANIRDLRTWLPSFAHLELGHHSETHPPGPILYYYAVIKLFGIQNAALIGGLGVGVLASAGIAVIYRFSRLWTLDRHARLGPCFLYAALPALLIFVPEFDQFYPVLSMAMMIFWHRALEGQGGALWLGLTLFVGSLLAYNLLTMGAPLALLAFISLSRRGFSGDVVGRAVVAGAVALGVALAAHLALWSATSFHAIDSFLGSLATQSTFSARLARPYLPCLYFDLYDFLLGGGFITLPLIAISLSKPTLPAPVIDRAMTLLGLASILIVDLTGVLRCEASRVWLFLQPFVVVPAGLALASWGVGDRALILAMELLVCIVLRCKMLFIW